MKISFLVVLCMLGYGQIAHATTNITIGTTTIFDHLESSEIQKYVVRLKNVYDLSESQRTACKAVSRP